MTGRTGLLLMTAVAATAALAPGAAAEVDVLRGKFKPVGPSEQISQKVRCPDGLRVAGGGAYTTGSSLEDEVSDSAPLDGKDADAKPDDGWIGAVNGGGGPEAMRTWAICTDEIKLSYSSAPAQSVSSGAEITAPCPAGHDAVGGGMRVKGLTTTSPLKASIQNGLVIGWQSSAINVADPPNLATGYAICSPSNRVERAGGSQNMAAGGVEVVAPRSLRSLPVPWQAARQHRRPCALDSRDLSGSSGLLRQPGRFEIRRSVLQRMQGDHARDPPSIPGSVVLPPIWVEIGASP